MKSYSKERERRNRRLLAEYAEASGAMPRGQKDKVMPPKKLFLALTISNQEPTLSVCHIRPILGL